MCGEIVELVRQRHGSLAPKQAKGKSAPPPSARLGPQVAVNSVFKTILGFRPLYGVR